MSERTKKIETIFHAASELSTAEERESYLNEACLGNEGLRREVDALLKAALAGEVLFQGCEQSCRASSIPAETLAEQPGTVIGRYKLLEKIGEGGMGLVHMAEQREPVVRKVALKVIKAGMDTGQVVARFEAERQALALMDHPNIAKVLDGGATESGRPYFVMDLVQGLPITQFCDEARLSMRERLDLFLEVCSAIQHAHQKGIIHRDIKPSNILVTLHGDKPVPKVIDFGIAKATQQPLTDKTLFTQFQHFLGTPAYMSPEQASLSGLDIDTRSDIYGLGVLLYEMLTGKTPFDTKELIALGLDEMRRTIREKEPVRPSTRLSTMLEGELTTTAQRRSAEAPKLIHQLRGDLDWIVMKCLEKDRTRRYDTATALAMDIDRYLSHEPVVARPPSVAYQLQKLIQRHRTASAAAALVVGVMAIGALISTWALVREHRSRERADERLQSALRFMDAIFTNVAPKFATLIGATQGHEALAQTGLSFVEELRARANDDPDLKLAVAQVLLRLSGVQGAFGANQLGDYEGSLKSIDAAIELLQTLPVHYRPADRLKALHEAQLRAAQALWGMGRLDEGLARLEQRLSLEEEMKPFPELADAIRRGKLRYHSDIASFLNEMGRPREALELHLLPMLRSQWASEVNDSSSSPDLIAWSSLNYWLLNAYESLGEWESVIRHARAARHAHEILARREPQNSYHRLRMVGDPMFEGHAVMRLGRIEEGLALLKTNQQAMENLAAQDPASRTFQRVLILAASRLAQGLADWSTEASASLAERRDRLAQAEAHLARAESLFAAVKPKPLQPDILTDMKRARTDVVAAKAKLERGNTSETQSPPPQ